MLLKLFIVITIVHLLMAHSHSDRMINLMFLGAGGLTEDILTNLPSDTNHNIQYQVIPVPDFDHIVQAQSSSDGIRYCVDLLSKYLYMSEVDQCEGDVTSVLVSASRGCSCVLEAIYKGNWQGITIFISPILIGSENISEDSYDDMVSLLMSKNVQFHVSTGTSTDENLLIYEPIHGLLEGGYNHNYSAQYSGDHDWWTDPTNWNEFINYIIRWSLNNDSEICLLPD